MFTGIVEDVGVVATRSTGCVDIAVSDRFLRNVSLGGSVAVNGVCLTIREMLSNGFRADVSPETTRQTTLGSLRSGRRVNLERPLTLDRGLDGHLVLGHVDTIGRISALYRDGDAWALHVSFPPSFAQYVAEKGSIAVDGISLTCFAVEPDVFRCSVIRETMERTTLSERHSGDPVNLEFDILAKYVERTMTNVHRH